MLEGKQLIRATRPFAKEDRAKSWWHTLTTLLALGLGYFFILGPFPLLVQIMASILTGLTLVRMFVIYHDYAHRSILQRSVPAQILFTLYGLIILAPLSIWRRSHDYHHKHNSKLYTSSIGSYPIVTAEKYQQLSPRDQRVYGFMRHPLTIGFGYIFVFLVGFLFRSFSTNPRKHWDSGMSLLVHAALLVTAFLLGGWSVLLLAIVLPFLVACAMGAYLFYAQHNFPGVAFADKEGWTFINAALESSSYMKMSKVMHWFTGNIGYHHIHHLNEAIPFYRLPEAYEAIPALQTAKTTSLNIKDIIACFRLKVWDPKRQRMLSWSEARQAA